MAFGAAWLLVAGVAIALGMYLTVHLTSIAWRVVIDLIILLVSTAGLMLASDNFESCLTGRLRGWGGWLQWLTTSFVVLTVVVILGAPLSLVFSDSATTSDLFVDFGIDILLAVLAGIVAVGLILVVAEVLGRAIWRLQRREERKERWRPRPHSRKGVLRLFLRGVALAVAGLLLTAIYTAVVTTVTNNPAGGADAPVPRDSSFVLFVLLPVLVWFAGTAAVWWAFRRRRPSPGEPDLALGQDAAKEPDFLHEPHRALLHGTHASALAICMMIFALAIAATGLESTARKRLWSHGTDTVPTIQLTDQQASLDSPYLAQQFEPQLWLAEGESWDPTEVTWYLGQNSKPNRDPPFCNTAGCYEISKSCDGPHPSMKCAPSGADDLALYYRYVNAANDPGDQRPADPNVDWTIIQYWVFYNYDSLDTSSVTQWHQSDWEQVSVLVRRDRNTVTPVEVGFSEHCYGALLPAEYVRWTPRAHPVVYVGRGSHANYPRRTSVPVRQLRCSLAVTPRYFGVAGLFFSPALDGSRLEIPVAYLIGLRDHTSRIQPTPPLKLVPTDVLPSPNVAKYWGLNNSLSLFGSAALPVSAGPPAPQVQGPWTMPIKKMLCSADWLKAPPVRRSETAWICR